MFAKVHGFGFWPGQVMDPAQATDPKVLSLGSDKKVLVSFFGDSSYGWFLPEERWIRLYDKHLGDSGSREELKKSLGKRRAKYEEVRRPAWAGLGSFGNGLITSLLRVIAQSTFYSRDVIVFADMYLCKTRYVISMLIYL